MENFHVVYLTGAPASGKTTLAYSLKEQLSSVVVLSYGELLTEKVRRRNSDITSQEDIREKSSSVISWKDVQELDNEVIEIVSQKRTSGHVVIDSHPVTKEEFGFRITPFSLKTLRKINPTIIINLYVDPDATINRIGKDAAGRPVPSPHEALMHNYLQGSVATTYAIELGIPAYFVDGDKSAPKVFSEVEAILRK